MVAKITFSIQIYLTRLEEIGILVLNREVILLSAALYNMCPTFVKTEQIVKKVVKHGKKNYV